MRPATPLRRRLLCIMTLVLLRRSLLLVLLPTAVAQAQDVPRTFPAAAPSARDSATGRIPDQKTFANPSVLGQGPSKGLIVRYERLPQFNVGTTAQVVGLRNYDGAATKNARISIKAYIPAVNHPHLKVIVGLSYEREEFKFSQLNQDNELINNIEDKGLKSTAVQLAVIRPVDEVHWYLARFKAELAGDYTSSELSKKNYLRTSAEAFYGWKRSPHFSWGLGFQYGYTFGRLSFYPAVIYNRTFSDRWGVEALFPARVLLRYNASPTSLFYTGYGIDGLNFIVHLRDPLVRRTETGLPDPAKTPLQTLELRQIELKYRLRYERELLSFLWMGAETGYRYNYAFDAFDRTNADREKIISSTFAGTPYFSLELFLVPPRKLMERAGVRR